MIERNRVVQLVVFGLLALLSYGVFEKYFNAESGTIYEPFTKGYSLEGVVIKTTNKKGNIVSTIESPSVIHYADSELTVINRPKYTLHQNEGDWVFSSSKGEINKEQTQLYFPERVSVFLNSKKEDRITIQTSRLTVDINKKTGLTNDRIILKKAGFLLKGLGSIINFTDQSIETLEEMYAEFEN